MARVNSTGRWLPALMLILVFAIDRAHKTIMLHVLDWQGGEAIIVTPNFDYVLVWNTGVSYGLLSTIPAIWLSIAMIMVILALAIWWWRADNGLTRWGLSLALGGALGNVFDRLAYGAVADFFSLHAGNYYFYIFNIADVGITFGVIFLIADMVLPRRRIAK